MIYSFFNHRNKRLKSLRNCAKSILHRVDILPTINSVHDDIVAEEDTYHREDIYQHGIGDSSVSSFKTALVQVRQTLTACGLTTFLSSSVGGELTQKTIKTVVLRLAEILCWTYWEANKTPLLPNNIFSWMKALLITNYKLIIPYVSYMQNIKQRSAATILHTLVDIKRSIIWFVSFRDDVDMDGDTTIERQDIDALFLTIRSVTKNLKKILRKERSGDDRITLSSIVFQRKLPVDGLKGLVENLRLQMPWVEDYIAKIKNREFSVVIDKDMYDAFMQTLYASFYCFAPQGRIGGIADLLCFNGIEMLKNGFTQSSAFKTCGTYGYQPVVVGDISSVLLQYYIEHVRPIISECPTESSPNEPLWLLFNGSKATNSNISHRVTR